MPLNVCFLLMLRLDKDYPRCQFLSFHGTNIAIPKYGYRDIVVSLKIGCFPWTLGIAIPNEDIMIPLYVVFILLFVPRLLRVSRFSCFNIMIPLSLVMFSLNFVLQSSSYNTLSIVRVQMAHLANLSLKISKKCN